MICALVYLCRGYKGLAGAAVAVNRAPDLHCQQRERAGAGHN